MTNDNRQPTTEQCPDDYFAYLLKKAFEAAMQVFALSKKFPREKVYSWTDQMRRSSRSGSANLAEAWRKRRTRQLSLAN